MRSVIVAYSGGVDSALLVQAARDALQGEGTKLLAVTARSSTYPETELSSAVELARAIGVQHRIIESEELDIPGFADNTKERCFYCKGELFGILTQIAKDEGYAAVCDGANADDVDDYRPGRKAAQELGVRSPLIEAGMTKEDIRHHARRLGLPNWDKPSAACLASRFPYGEKITAEKLKRVEQAEAILKSAGFRQLRVRDHGGMARIEVAREDIVRLAELAPSLSPLIKELGFNYVTVDMEGYRTGSLNLFHKKP
ncbi:MAG: ATP-dependent sacrificial sulfur transferase LarE [Nitrospinae bacterium]|nr:ATP-dependent sacrificial sulfur transferase LarE [Nitrospinota bacterium]